jgi:hypothetical protein
MLTLFCLVALVATLATPVSLLRKVWEGSLAKAVYDALVKPGPAPVPPTSTPTSASGVG